MSKFDYINELIRQLEGLPDEEIDKAVEYYNEYFSEAMDNNQSEAAIIAKLGSPETVALRIRATFETAVRGSRPKAKYTSAIIIGVLAFFLGSVALAIVMYATNTANVYEYKPAATAVPVSPRLARATVAPTAPLATAPLPAAVAVKAEALPPSLNDVSGEASISIPAGIPSDYSQIVPELKKIELVIGNEVDSIELVTHTDGLIIVRGSDKLKLSYFDRFGGDFSIDKNGSTLTFKLSEHFSDIANKYRTELGNQGILISETCILYVPEGISLKKLEIASAIMDLTIKESIEIHELSVAAANTELDVTAASLGEVNIEAANAETDFTDTSLSMLNLDANNAELDFTNGNVDLLAMNSANLSVSVDHSAIGSMELNAANCELDLSEMGNFDDYSIAVTGVVGELSMNGAEISGKNKASALASLIGDKKITINAANWELKLSE